MGVSQEIVSAIKQILEPVKRLVLMTVGRAVILAVKDSGNLQTVQASFLAAETKDDMERFQQYGFTSVPLPGAEGIGVFVGGQREHGIMIGVDDRRFRLKSLGAGQVALYDAFGTKIVLSNDGQIKLTAAIKVTVEAPLVDLGTGALESVLNGETFQTFFNAHVHNSSAPGAPTSPPVIPSTILELSQAVKAAKLPI